MKIEKRDKIILAGCSFYGDPFTSSSGWTEENEIGRLWNRLMTYLNKTKEPISKLLQNKEWFEVWIENEESRNKGFFEIFIGTNVDSVDDVPYDLQIKLLPATQYAVFTVKGEKIKSDWAYQLYQKGLKEKKYRKSSYEYCIELYDERFKGVDKILESELDYYFPIEK
ncbi:MAG: GyrI-like domain-containing protein [Candidatus Cloacimonetes bacterium]|nr:GyrI-like domain-containing protein [Candidatus Cloacimonadota bacterium]